MISWVFYYGYKYKLKNLREYKNVYYVVIMDHIYNCSSMVE